MAENQADKEVKKSPKKLILIIVGTLLLVGLVAGGGYFYLTKTGKAEHPAEEPKEAEKHEQVVEPDVYYQLSSPLVVDFAPGSSAKVIKISLAILVQGEANVAILKKHEPMIRNNLLMTVSAIGADKAKSAEGKQELRGLMLAEIGKVLEKMAGKNSVKDVYFTEFVMQ